MLKKLLLGLLILALIAGAAVYFVLSGGLNQQIKKGVEKYGPQVTQTAVTLEDVNLSILSGNGSITGLKVANPEGFKSANIFSLGEIDLQVDTSTVLSDKIIIDHILIKKPEISYEKTLRSSNLKQLLQNIEEFTGPADSSDDTAATPEPDTGAKKQVVIKQLVIEEGTVYVGVMGVGQTVTLPRIEMNDIGEDGKQMTMAEAIDLVLSKVLQSIGPAIANAGELGGAAVDALKTQGLEKVDQASEKIGESIKGLFDK